MAAEMRDDRRVPMIGVGTQRRAWRPGGRRPGHPRHRTVRHHRRPAEASTPPGPMAATRGDTAQAHRRRAGHLGGHASPAGVYLRGALAAPRPAAPAPPVSLPARPVRLQQAPAGAGRRLPAGACCSRTGRAAAGLLQRAIRVLASDTTWWTDDVWVGDSTPVECGRSTQTAHRSELAGWAEYGYCASHSRYFWGLRLHLVCTLHGLPVGFALAGAKADEREVLLGILAADPTLLATRPNQTLIADKNYFGGAFEAALTEQGVRLLRPARKGEPDRAGAHLFRPLRQVIESINDTFKGQLDLERHGGHTPAGVIARVLQRILALTAAIWHNDHTSQPVARSLVAYDH